MLTFLLIKLFLVEINKIIHFGRINHHHHY